jgi:membrane fusion protein (multidrug efflux system)
MPSTLPGSSSPPSAFAARWRALSSSFALLAAGLTLAGCEGGDAKPAPAPPPAPSIGVVVAAPQRVGIVTELPGRLEPRRIAQVRARVAGVLQTRLFREGSDVKAGQTLFRIEAAPYQAAVQSAEANLARAEANAAAARVLAQRYAPLVEANAVSRQDYANAVAGQKAADAEIAASRAALATARINLGYATVTAPIGGRIGRALVTEGALVGQGDATELAVIQQIDPLYLNFTQPASDVFRLRREMAEGRLARASGDEAASVQVVLDDGSVYPQAGRLLFSDLTVETTTGQILLRAEVPNPRGELLPGMYVRVRISQAEANDAILVPQQAVTRTQQGDTLMVVAPDRTVATRQVTLSGARGNQWVVLAGLKAGEQVVVDGFQKLQMMPPGPKVNPVPWTPLPPGRAAGGGMAPASAAASR